MYALNDVANALTLYNTMRNVMTFELVSSTLEPEDRELLIDILSDLWLIKESTTVPNWWDLDSTGQQKIRREWVWDDKDPASD